MSHNLNKKCQNVLYGFRRANSGPVVMTDAHFAAARKVQPDVTESDVKAYLAAPYRPVTRTASAVAAPTLAAAKMALVEMVKTGILDDETLLALETEIEEKEKAALEAAKTSQIAALKALIAAAK